MVSGFAALAMSACSSPNSSIGDMVKELVAKDIASFPKESWCMNENKIVSASDNIPLSLANIDSTASNKDNSFTFPLIFSEEAFVSWTRRDKFIMDLLIGGNFIKVYSGGYPASDVDPGQPGDAYKPKTFDEVARVVADIAKRGAEVDLTKKGKTNNVWDPSNGFCITGNWKLHKLLRWTPPATNSAGVQVTHIYASREFDVDAIGKATQNINPYDLYWEIQNEEYVASKYNNGWRITADPNTQ